MSAGAGFAAALAGALALAGCRMLGLGDAPERAPAPVMDPVEARLAEAAVRAQAALTRLAEMRAAAADLRAPEIPTHVPPELLAQVSMDFIGPLEALAKTLAMGAGYALVTAGRPPPTPVMVEIEARDRPLIHVFRDAGMQAADRALLTVDAGRMTVRLDWLAPPPDGAARQ